MPPVFDAYEYAGAMGRLWRTVAAACAVAVSLALAVSLLAPKRYTATATIVIEPPGTNDLRTATAVSPVYLESLKSFEHFAASDTLFARAVERFHLLGGSAASIESLKHRILKVTKPRDTKILEIAVTLTDSKLAQACAQFLAEETAALSRRQNLAADRELIDEAERQRAEAQAKLEQAQAARLTGAAQEPVEALLDNVGASTELLSKFRQELMTAETEAAEDAARRQGGDSAAPKQQGEAARARIPVIHHRIAELETSLARDSAVLGRRMALAEQRRNDLESAKIAFEAAAAHWREVTGAEGARGERLRLLDPGIVPQRPSSPNLPLNVIAAFFAALVVSVTVLSAQFALARARREHRADRLSRIAKMP